METRQNCGNATQTFEEVLCGRRLNQPQQHSPHAVGREAGKGEAGSTMSLIRGRPREVIGANAFGKRWHDELGGWLS